ncbi:MAG TPA: DNA polymerase III subunit gamma/tau, partial [Candidatus Deferrimicrobiaceae bacterium]|nr:DNA polymerase III subunit gamma/tau [Candidatus Deferrimicrobiaceae bacterium]
MAYEALARKWRPKGFDEVVGQGHVTRALANAISLGKIHHAYLFSGTRGVGKTTFARILARALNCEKGPTASPCMECPACREILAGAATDVQEIDGASNTGIDDVRRLRENAAYAPARLRYKIYIIDEVHMLSKSAFNGLLKILEEPPPHTIFVFATTEPNRIPDTILSRVQRFDFRMLSDEEIRKRLKEMAEAEGIQCEEDALGLMSRYAFGSMRDGQSIFEQAAVSGNGRITAALVEEMLGLVGTEAAIDLAGAVVSGGAGEAIGKFSALLSRGADMKYLYLSLVDVLRDAAVWKFTEDDRLLFRHSPSSLSRVKELCGLRSREEWMFLLDIAFRSEKDVLGTEFPRLGFELLLLRLVNAPGLLDVEGLAEESGPPKAPSQTTFAKRPMPTPASAQGGAPPPHPSPAAPIAAEARKGKEGELWDALLKNLGAKKKTVLLLGLLSQMKGRREGDELVIASPHQFVLDRLREEDKWPVLLQAVAEVAGKKLEVRLVVSGEKKSPEADKTVRKEEDRPEKRALSDPMLTEVLREFEGATILEVRPAPGGAIPPGAAGAEEPEPDESGNEEAEGR